MTANALHVTNGDSVLYLWKKSGLPGTHLAWRDALNEGPLRADLALPAHSRMRADYLSSRGYGNPIKIHRDLEKRDAVIARAQTFEEIVLWFEHDLYDQLQLLQILAVLHDAGLGAGSVQLILSNTYLGNLTGDELMALYPKRRFITTAIAQAARTAWHAVASPEPHALRRALDEKYPGLPFMRDALLRLCEEYPDVQTGLSRSQKQILESSAPGPRRRDEVFHRSQAREEASFLGDAGCYALIDDLCAPPAPLLSQSDAGVELTVLGRRVLAGDTDWLEHQPADRWIGGVHLDGERCWRWDEARANFV